jgi:hypothetical protein
MNLNRIKKLLSILPKENFDCFSTEELIKIGNEIDKRYKIILTEKIKRLQSEINSTLPIHYKNLYKIELQSNRDQDTKINIPILKSIFLSIAKENFSCFTEVEIYSFEDELERIYKRISISSIGEKIRNKIDSIPPQYKELYKIESKKIPIIKNNTSEEQQEKILKMVDQSILNTLKKVKKYKILLEQIKKMPLEKAIIIVEKLSKDEKIELSLVVNLPKNESDKNQALFSLNQNKNNNLLWIKAYQTNREVISVFDFKIK